MNLRPKTKRRLLVLLTGAALSIGGAALFVHIQLQRHESVRLQYRTAAMTAFNRGDYPAALDGLSKYLSNNNDDVSDAEAIYAYAVARSKLPRPDFSHLTEAKETFKRYLAIKPDDARAQHQLLEIYEQLGYQAETISLADTLLARDAGDVPVLKAKMHTLDAQAKREDALAVAKQVDDLLPTDLDAQITTYRLMRQLKRPVEQIVARADGMLKEHPNDPRFELLRAVAASVVGDSAGTQQWLLSAASRTPPDAAFVRELAGVFDRAGMYDQARAMLEKAAATDTGDPQLLATLVQREWESGQYREALDQLKGVDPNNAKCDSRLIALKALTLYCIDASPPRTSSPSTAPATAPLRAQADLLVATLDARVTDNMAGAWSSLLKAHFANPPLDPRQELKIYQSVIARDHDNAIAAYWLGLDYRQLGESEMALQQWQKAASLAPAWVEPRVVLARLDLATGHLDDAATEAQFAAARSPNLLAVQTTLALVYFAELDPKAADTKIAEMIRFVGDIQTAAPNEPQTLPIYVALLTRANRRDDAANAIRASMSAVPPLPSDALLKLAQVDASAHLGLDKEIGDAAIASAPHSPDTALDAAMTLATTGRAVDGLKLITTAASPGDSPEWQLAIARYREMIGDPGVLAAWTTLSDTNPRTLAIQQAVLDARSAWADPALIDRTIDRLKTLTGDDAIEWRLARARWKLATPDTAGENANAAALMMADVLRATPNNPEPLVIWAQALEKRGDIAGAIDRLRTADTLSHGDPNVAMYLAALLQKRGNLVEARSVLAQVALHPSLNRSGRVQCARMLSMQGQYDDAIAVLRDPTAPADGTDIDRDLLLAQLLQAQGKADEAAKLYDGVLKSPLAADGAVRAVAWFHASQGNTAAAQTALDRLNTMKLAPGAKELTLAAFDEQFRDADSARAQFQAATIAAPSNPATWAGLAGFDIRHHDFPAAATAADQGLKIVPNDSQLAALSSDARTLTTLTSGISGDSLAELQPLIAALAGNPADPAAVQTLNALAQSQANHDSSDQAMARLRDVADQQPRFLPVQMLLAGRYYAAGRFEDADQIATRAMQTLVTEPEPARVLSTIAAAAGRWDRALTAAYEWRNRTLDHPQAADERIAEAKLHLNDPDGAIKQLEPHLDRAKAAPDAMPQIINLYARALAQRGNASDAQALLEPLIKQSPAWRATWLDIGTTTAKDPATATAWIDRAASLIDTKTTAEQFRLASAWYNVGQRFVDNASLTKARDLLKPLIDGPAAIPTAQLLYGSIAQLLGDLPGAESAYRAAMKTAGAADLPMLRNNLAYTILLRDGDLGEARQLAESAVAAAPTRSAYQDTLARIYARLGDLQSALTAFQNAVRADATNLEALIGLADAQARTGQRDKAENTLQRVDTLLRSNPPLADPVRRQLDDLRASMKKPAESPSAEAK
jgi:tetratricopeptide (TPR) repeat protein